MKRGGGLRTFADGDAVAVASAEVVVDHEVLAIGWRLLLQRLQAERHADQPAAAHETRVPARQRHGADNLSDAHGRPVLVRCRPRRPGSAANPPRKTSAKSA